MLETQPVHRYCQFWFNRRTCSSGSTEELLVLVQQKNFQFWFNRRTKAPDSRKRSRMRSTSVLIAVQQKKSGCTCGRFVLCTSTVFCNVRCAKTYVGVLFRFAIILVGGSRPGLQSNFPLKKSSYDHRFRCSLSRSISCKFPPGFL